MSHIVSICGTSRPGNFTSRALAVVNAELARQGHQVDYYDAVGLKLAFPGSPPTPDAEHLIEAIKKSTGVVLASPEYHGSFSAMTKLIIENLGFPSALSGKPIALLGVAAGRIGAIKSLEQLRNVCAHTGAIVLPGAVSIAGVGRSFNENGVCTDEATERALKGLATRMQQFLEQFVFPRQTLEEMARHSDSPWPATV